MMAQIVNKRVNLRLVGLDGNAFVLMGAFSRQARREKWTQQEIDAVLSECKSGNYDHLLGTLMDHCVNDGDGPDDEDCADDDEPSDDDEDDEDE